MFTTGSKLLLGAAVLATVAAVVYGLTQDGSLGTIGLISAAVALAFLAGVNLVIRDTNVSAMDPAATTESAAAAPAPGASMWPIVAALGAVLARRRARHLPGGLRVRHRSCCSPPPSSGWCRRGASGRRPTAATTPTSAGGSPTRSSSRCSAPSALGIIIYSFSRIMLFLSKTERAGRVRHHRRARPARRVRLRLQPSVRSGAIAVVALLAPSGWSPAAPPPRSRASASCTPTRPSATSPRRASATRPRRPRPTSTPRRASPPRRTSPARSSCAATAALTARVDRRRPASVDTFVVTQSNPSNVLFRNESGEERRLVLDLGTRPELDEDGDEIDGSEVPNQCCTALVEEGGSAVADVPDRHAELGGRRRPYRFFVPGVEGAELRGGRAVRARYVRATVRSRRPSSRRRRSPAVGLLVVRLRQGRPAGHVAARGRQRPEDPEPAVAGVPHRRHRRPDRRRGHQLGARSATATAASRSPSRRTASRRSRSG